MAREVPSSRRGGLTEGEPEQGQGKERDAACCTSLGIHANTKGVCITNE